MRFASPTLHGFEIFYRFFIKIGSNLQSLFLLYMRLTWGHQFMVAGWKKLHTIEQTAQFFSSIHIHYPLFNAYLVGWVEFLGGIALVVGFASRAASFPLILVMLTAIGSAHAKEISNFRFLLQPLSLVNLAPYPFLITSFVVFIFGPGRISLDAGSKRWSGNWQKY